MKCLVYILFLVLLPHGAIGCGGKEEGRDAAAEDDTAEPRPDMQDGQERDVDAAGDPYAEPPVECDGNCHYIRQEAGGTNDGSEWENAWTSLPEALERGHLYYVAAGRYGGYGFDDPPSGNETIFILKATSADHGTDAGWEDGFAEGSAVFGSIEITQPWYHIDGRAGRGIECIGEYEGSVVSIRHDHVTILNVDMNGDFSTDASGYHAGGACTGLSAGGSHITIAGCRIHDVADDGVSMSGCRNVDFSGNTVHRLHACGTDGGCGPCYNGHSDGIEIYNVKDGRFTCNFIYDVRSTACLFFGNWADSLGGGPDEYCGTITLANNIFYSPDTGFVAYIQDVDGVQVFNNVFWGLRQGRYGGMSVGQHVTDMDMYNNIILSINNEHVGGAYDPAHHRSDYNFIGASIGQFPEGDHDIVDPDPRFSGIPDASGPEVADPDPGGFSLTAGSPCIDGGYAGDGAIPIPARDFFGNPRGARPDMGAVEYTGT